MSESQIPNEPSASVEHVVKQETLEELSDIFCFETDHVALKGNTDYQELLKTVAVLESQRTQAIQDLDKLIQAKESAQKDPISFVHKLQQQIDLGLPKPQCIAELPQIDWSAYTDSIESLPWSHKHRTRYKKQVEETSSAVSSRSTTPTSLFTPETLPIHSTQQSLHHPQGHPQAHRVSERRSSEDIKNILVRGKAKDESKSSTFNQLWTADEQRRLEELLTKYPPEEVEARRWEKIARELGNRTKFQVQSRMQKYLLRLAREGLPLPGRMPQLHSQQRRRQQYRPRQYTYPDSTMCVSYRPPVFMSDDEDSGSYSYSMNDLDEGQPIVSEIIEVSDEEDVPASLRHTEEYKEIMELKRQRKIQLRRAETFKHVGFRCDRCCIDPIPGTRWHCTDCPDEESVDFCDDCSDFVFETMYHKSDHHLEPIRALDTMSDQLDTDYTPSQFIPGDYNYLDPNYMPAT